MLTPRQRIEVALQSARQQVKDLELALKELPEDNPSKVSEVIMRHAAKTERTIIRKSKS